MLKKLKDLVVLFALGAAVYVILNRESAGPAADDAVAFARSACADAIRVRYSARSVKPYEVEKSNRGYVVRAAATLPRGNVAKISCLANEFGGVEDFEIDER
jgi:hypothetical protein